MDGNQDRATPPGTPAAASPVGVAGGLAVTQTEAESGEGSDSEPSDRMWYQYWPMAGARSSHEVELTSTTRTAGRPATVPAKVVRYTPNPVMTWSPAGGMHHSTWTRLLAATRAATAHTGGLTLIVSGVPVAVRLYGPELPSVSMALTRYHSATPLTSGKSVYCVTETSTVTTAPYPHAGHVARSTA